MNNKLVSSAKCCTLLDVSDRFKSLIDIINSKGRSKGPWPCGTPWIHGVISWKFESFPVTLMYCFLSERMIGFSFLYTI